MPAIPAFAPVELRLTLITLPPLSESDLRLQHTIAPYFHWLSQDELDRIARARLPGLAARQALVRLCLRAQLAILTDRGPASLVFDYGPQGKPALRDRGLLFNQSHSGDLLLIGSVCGADPEEMRLGVDIERRRANTDIDTIYRHYFAAAEQAFLEELGEADRIEAFFDLWALKESFIKATGRGLAEGLKSFGFELSAASRVDVAGLCSFYQGISLSRFGITEPEGCKTGDEHWHWQSALGRIDNEFRLAYSLATPLPRPSVVQLMRPDWLDLLRAGASLEVADMNQPRQPGTWDND